MHHDAISILMHGVIARAMMRIARHNRLYLAENYTGIVNFILTLQVTLTVTAEAAARTCPRGCSRTHDMRRLPEYAEECWLTATKSNSRTPGDYAKPTL